MKRLCAQVSKPLVPGETPEKFISLSVLSRLKQQLSVSRKMSNRKRERVEQTSHKVIEKRRRDRINNCLFELSQTVPAAFSKQTSGKLEKAEILEMTVEYLRAVQTTEIGMRFDNVYAELNGPAADSTVDDFFECRVLAVLTAKGGEWFSTDIWGDFAQHYQTGYSECVREVLKYMADVEGIAVSDTRCARLLSFLHNRFRSDVATSAAGNGSSGAAPPLQPPPPLSLPVGSSLGNAGGNSGSHLGSYVSSRAGFLTGMVTSASPRDVPGLNSVKTVSSLPHGGLGGAGRGGGGGSSGFDTRLTAFPPYIPPAVSSSAGDSSRSPLHGHPASAASPPRGGHGTLSVVPPSSSPFRPLHSLAIPAVDYLRFPPTVSFLPRTHGGMAGAGLAAEGLPGKDSAGFAVGPLPGLPSYAPVRKDASSSV